MRVVTCAVNALVDATPISCPQCVYEPELVLRGIDDPTTLHTPYTKAPALRANSIAASESAVSPD